MGCKYFKCEPKVQALCCINTSIEPTAKEIEEHKERLNEKAMLLGLYGGLVPKEVIKLRKRIGETAADIYTISELARGIDKPILKIGEKKGLMEFAIELNVIFYFFEPLTEKESIDLVRNIGGIFNKCPYYDEKTKKCSVYSNRFWQCKLFPKVELGEFFLEICKKCNPESCLEKKNEGAISIQKLRRQNLILKKRYHRELLELKMRVRKVLRTYLGLLGHMFNNSTEKEIIPYIKGFLVKPTYSKEQMFFGGGEIVSLPYPPLFQYLLYREFGWSLWKSIKGVSLFLDYLDKIGEKEQKEIFKVFKTLLEDSLYLSAYLRNRGVENLLDNEKYITQGLNRFFEEFFKSITVGGETNVFVSR
jgi:Fe-S-cluster containining protein